MELKMTALTNLYADAVKRGDRKIEDVPAVLRDQVQAVLNAEPAKQSCYIIYVDGNVDKEQGYLIYEV